VRGEEVFIHSRILRESPLRWVMAPLAVFRLCVRPKGLGLPSLRLEALVSMTTSTSGSLLVSRRRPLVQANEEADAALAKVGLFGASLWDWTGARELLLGSDSVY
jgi:hypothetical protein